MNKIKILTVALLVATSFSSMSVAQEGVGAPAIDTSGSGDVANQLYNLNQGITRQQAILESRHQDLVEAIQEYDKDPSAKNAFTKALMKDVEAAEKYSNLVAQANTKIAEAQTKFYEETPATKTEIETGPKGKGAPSGGESVESEIPMAETNPPMIESRLKTEIRNNGGLKGDFASQLKEQTDKLKSVKKRIEDEANDPAIKSNPTAKKENSDLQSILSKAIDARRKALGED